MPICSASSEMCDTHKYSELRRAWAAWEDCSSSETRCNFIRDKAVEFITVTKKYDLRTFVLQERSDKILRWEQILPQIWRRRSCIMENIHQNKGLTLRKWCHFIDATLIIHGKAQLSPVLCRWMRHDIQHNYSYKETIKCSWLPQSFYLKIMKKDIPGKEIRFSLFELWSILFSFWNWLRI